MSVSGRRSSLIHLRTNRAHLARKLSRLQVDDESCGTSVRRDFINTFPYELSVFILQLAIALSERSSKRLIELASVSSAWRTIIVSSPVFWKHFDFSGDTAWKTLDLWESRAKGERSETHGKNAQSFTSMTIDCWNGTDVESFYRAFQGWAGLQELTISLHWNTPFLTSSVLSLLHLKKLEIRCLSETNPAHSRITLEGMDTSQLRVLSLHRPKDLSSFLLSSQSWPALQSLEIIGSFHHQKQLSSLEAIFARNPNIENLALINNQAVALGFGESSSDVALENYLPPITGQAKLRSLSIRMPYGVTESWLRMFVPSSLEVLDINVPRLCVLANFFNSLPSHNPLQEAPTTETTPKPNLIDLRVSVPGFSESDLLHLAEALPNLEMLRIKRGRASGMNINLHPQMLDSKSTEKHLFDCPRVSATLRRFLIDDGDRRCAPEDVGSFEKQEATYCAFQTCCC